MRTLTLYGRPGCELCEDMKKVVNELAERIPFELRVIDVTGDAELERRYGLDVPVLLVDGREAFRHRVTAPALRRFLREEP